MAFHPQTIQQMLNHRFRQEWKRVRPIYEHQDISKTMPAFLQKHDLPPYYRLLANLAMSDWARVAMSVQEQYYYLSEAEKALKEAERELNEAKKMRVYDLGDLGDLGWEEKRLRKAWSKYRKTNEGELQDH